MFFSTDQYLLFKVMIVTHEENVKFCLWCSVQRSQKVFYILGRFRNRVKKKKERKRKVFKCQFLEYFESHEFMNFVVLALFASFQFKLESFKELYGNVVLGHKHCF